MIKLSSMVYQTEARRKAGNLTKEWMSGIIGTLHKSGNGFNYNVHSHIVATRELINTKTGEISKDPFIPYDRMRMLWMKDFLQHLVRYKYISQEESKEIKQKYKIVFSSFSRTVIRHIKKNYSLKNGYFRPKSSPP